MRKTNPNPEPFRMKKSHAFLGTLSMLFTITCASCFDDSSSERIVGDYQVYWFYDERNRAIAVGDASDDHDPTSITEPYIYAVGHNEHFIIAARHTLSWDWKIQKDTTDYYIIEILGDRAKAFERETIYGPLPQKQFDSLRQKFKITHLQFNQTYE
jgi:hypothetical protein